jgi:hypothetical protein
MNDRWPRPIETYGRPARTGRRSTDGDGRRNYTSDESSYNCLSDRLEPQQTQTAVCWITWNISRDAEEILVLKLLRSSRTCHIFHVWCCLILPRFKSSARQVRTARIRSWIIYQECELLMTLDTVWPARGAAGFQCIERRLLWDRIARGTRAPMKSSNKSLPMETKAPPRGSQGWMCV